MGKERIIELKIEDDDLISGVDQISLVTDPAIMVDWFAFKKEEENFCVPEGEEDKYLEYLHSVGEKIEDLEKDGWVEIQETQMSKKDFAALASDPNGESNDMIDLDTRVRYRYGLAGIYRGEQPVIPTSRRFCKEMVASNRVYRLEDIQGKDNGMGSDAWTWRGSYNCRHNWFQVIYKKEGRIVNKASVNKDKVDPTEYGREMDLPSTKVTLSKNKFTLPLFEREEDAIDYSKLIGCEEGAHPHEIEGVTLWMPCASHPESMDIDVSGLPPYVDEVPEDCDECTKKRKKKDIYQDSYNDYPKQASTNAQIALRWAEENGWGDCGTPVGKQRANQLAKGENITRETIARMAAFERHRKNSDKELGDGCGRLMWLAWGGDEGIEWAQRKLKQIEKEEMADLEDACWPGYEPIGTKRKDGRIVPNCVPVENSKQIFSFQEEGEDQYTLVGPAMVPLQKIVRADMFGNKYYVYFTEETIKQISEKFMKRGYTRDSQHDIEHMGPGEKDVYVAESWIIEDPEHDKAAMYGFTDLPKGTWMVKMKVLNKEIWKLVKDGTLRGFSVSGYFEEYEREEVNAQLFLKELVDLLKKK